jgi:tRNA A37 threonylcarbamoyladenosine biosynthesis protein TsaE
MLAIGETEKANEAKKVNNNNYFFLDEPAGSGKTILYNTLMSVLRGEHKIVIPVASTGIVATFASTGIVDFVIFKRYRIAL